MLMLLQGFLVAFELDLESAVPDGLRRDEHLPSGHERGGAAEVD